MTITAKAFALCVGLTAVAFLNARADAVTVTIDGSQTNQVIEGFGANINHRSWNNNELQPVLDALIDEGGMTLFRVIFDKTDWEATNDNDDPAVMDWAYYNQVYSSPDFQKMWDLSAYLNRRGISDGLMFNFQGVGPDWMGGNALTLGYEAEWAEMIASLLVYARNTQHLQFNLVGPDNEQDNAWTQGIGMSTPQYGWALEALSELLDTNGLSDVRFVGPDLANTSTDWMSAMMDDPTIMAKLAHFGLHSYEDQGAGSAGVYDFLRQSPYPDRTYWMTEFNVWCNTCAGEEGAGDSWDYASGAARYLLYHLAYGASAALVWEGYDSQYYYYDHPGGWSLWGLFAVDDTNAVPKTYTPRKSFYTLAQVSRFVRPGAQQIAVAPWTSSPLALAFYHPVSGQLTITGINPDPDAQTLSGILTNLPPVASLDLYYTDPTTNLCRGESFEVTQGAFTATVPGNCVFTLVGFDPARLALSVLITNPPDRASYTAPATIPIQALANSTTGIVSRVEFFCGTTNIGEALAEPYGIIWSNVPPGTYVLTASATDSVGNSSVSPAVHVNVAGPIAQITIVPADAVVVPYGTCEFTATATDALGTVIQPPPTFAWSVSGGGYIDANGVFAGGDSVGGPYSVSASNDGVTGTASVSIATNANLAPVGLGYTWHSLTAPTDNSPRARAHGINDGDLVTDVSLGPGGDEDLYQAYEAAGVIWTTPQTINRICYYNGSLNTWQDGVFADEFGLQFSTDGLTWTDAGPEWTVAPPYVYNSSASANTCFTFAGGVAVVRGVRCVGRVHTVEVGTNSWVAFATELEAFAAPVEPVEPQIIVQPTNQTALVGTTADFHVAASGTPFLSYQWQFNGANLEGAVGDTLSLTNLQFDQGGSYRVVVTNIVGSTTSVVAMLTVLQYPLLVNPRVTTNGAFAFTLNGNAGCSYLIEVSTNLPEWAPLGTLSNTASQADFTDPEAANSVSRFYRARLAY